MSNVQTIVRYVRSSTSTSGDSLRIEQDAWNALVGRLTKANFVKYLHGALYDTADAEVDCGFNNGNLQCNVRVYPSREDLEHNIYISRGELSKPRKLYRQKHETLNFMGGDTTFLGYPVVALKTVEWFGSVYNMTGGQISPPEIVVNEDNSIEVGEPIVGSVGVTYMIDERLYVATVPPLENADENRFTAVVYGIYSGAPPVWINLTTPPNVDSGGECYDDSGGGAVTINGDKDDDEFDRDVSANRYTRMRYCDGAVLSDRTSYYD